MTEISCCSFNKKRLCLINTHTHTRVASAASFKGPGCGALPYHDICLCMCGLWLHEVFGPFYVFAAWLLSANHLPVPVLHPTLLTSIVENERFLMNACA